MTVCVWAHACHGARVEVRGEFWELLLTVCLSTLLIQGQSCFGNAVCFRLAGPWIPADSLVFAF